MPKLIKELPISKTQLEAFREREIKKRIVQAKVKLEAEFSGLCKEFQEKFANNKWIFLRRKDAEEAVYYVHDIAGVLPDLKVHECNRQAGDSLFNSDFLKNLQFAKFEGTVPTQTEVTKCFNDKLNYFRGINRGVVVQNTQYYGVTFANKNEYWYLVTWNDSNKDSIHPYGIWTGNWMATIPVFRFNGINSEAIPASQALLYWLQYDLAPDDEEFASAASRNAFARLKDIYAENKAVLTGTAEGISLDERKTYALMVGGTKFAFMPSDTYGLLTAEKIEGNKEYEDRLCQRLLHCDYERAMLDPYDVKLLTDPNRGHWELWDYGKGEEAAGKVILSKSLTARDPAEDVSPAGYVAIDFGTRSTVVVREDEYGIRLPLQVGNGSYGGGIKAESYENPTIVQFLHLRPFLEAFRSKEYQGRPATKWNDVTVSHTAFGNLTHSSSDMYYSFFDAIKQWCGGKRKNIVLRDQDGEEEQLKDFLDLIEDDFNPLAIYAYYLGLYINNMWQDRLYLHYLMSFPVSYPRNVREKMRRSFEDGLRKSLPTALLSNEEQMKAFRVEECASEPAAYAATALSEDGYNFPHGDEKKAYYAVFDFGGGTTDFDFGMYREAKEDEGDRYSYVLTRFGAQGDATLGGENLLRLLAFEIFKANMNRLLDPQKAMKASKATKETGQPTEANAPKAEAPAGNEEAEKEIGKIPFTWAADIKPLAGSQALVKNSQEACQNMHNLMESIRCLWEDPEGETAKKILSSRTVTTNLYTDNGVLLPNFSLYLGNETTLDTDDNAGAEQKTDKPTGSKQETSALPDEVAKKQPAGITPSAIIEARIRQGIDSFFYAMREAFDKHGTGEEHNIDPLTKVKEVSIFLAGNSSRSSVVTRLFEEYIGDGGKARAILGFAKDQKMCTFTLYPPLGTDEARMLQDKFGVKVPEDPMAAPTGKTGVAFGLLDCRPDSDIKVVSIVSKFQLYVGRALKRKFRVKLDPNMHPEEWHHFMDLAESDNTFALIYTEQPDVATDSVRVSVLPHRTVALQGGKAEPGSKVYIRAVGPRAIACAIVKDEAELEERKELEPIRVDL